MDQNFDLALSFAGTERDYARAIAAIVESNGVKVYLDELYQTEMWGQNLIETLADIYENRARYCLVIVSKEYAQRIYTNVERRAALERAIRNRTEYILPVVVDDFWIQGLPRSTVYLDLRRKSVIAICTTLVKKLRGSEAPVKLEIPLSVHIPRLALGALGGDDLAKYLLELTEQSARIGVVVFGCVIYDEKTAEIRKLFKDEDYWDALDAASGPSFEVFAIRDEVQYQPELPKISDRLDFLTTASLNRSQSRSYYFSRLLFEYFGEHKTRIAYPSVLLFLTENNAITHCRLIRLSRGTLEETFLRLQNLFSDVAEAIEAWRPTAGSAQTLWTAMKERLLDRKYKVYIKRPPSETKAAIEQLAAFIEE